MRLSSWRRQRGVALITVMMIVAIATAVSTLMMVRQQRAIARTASLMDSEQAWQYDLAAESFAMEVLAQDARNDASSGRGAVDSNFEIWARQWPPFPVDGGSVQGRIEDEQGLFNLNDLLGTDGQPNKLFLAAFQQLLMQNQIPVALSQAVIDWLDADNQPSGPMGAESDWYMRMPTPYRAANRDMASVSELRLIRGMTEVYYERLKPWVTVLPRGTLINVNTAKPQVLMALIPGISLVQANALIAAGAPNGYERPDSFLAEPFFASMQQAQLDTLGGMITTNSSYFRVTCQAEIDGKVSWMRSLIRRQSSTDLSVFYRERILPQTQDLASDPASGHNDGSGLGTPFNANIFTTDNHNP